MYTIGDFLIRIKNGYMAHRRTVEVPYSRVAESIGKILVAEGYLKDLKVAEEGVFKVLKFDLTYQKGDPAIHDIQIISRPSVQVYANKIKLNNLNRDIGMYIVSTSKGVMTGDQALKQSLGGEVLCQVI